MARAALDCGPPPGSPALDAGTAVDPRPALASRQRRLLQRLGALDVRPRPAVQLVDDPLPVLGVQLAEQLRAAEHAGLRLRRRLDEQLRHAARDDAVVDDGDGRPCIGPATGALLSPPAHDDDEVVLSDDRGCKSLAGAADVYAGVSAARPRPSPANAQSLLAAKLKGVTRTIATACAGRCPAPAATSTTRKS